MRVWPGQPYPLGATWDGAGVNFAIFSQNAERVELCLFDSTESVRESVRIHLKEQTNMVWHCYLPDARPGQLYGYRIKGPYRPNEGHRFNSNKVLLDPYAKSIARPLKWSDELFGYKIGDKKEDLSFDARDSAAYAPLAAVVDPAFTWGNDVLPSIPWHKTVIYEMHVKGFTKLHPGIPEEIRGTYAALASEVAIRHLQELGITAVELMPVHSFIDDRFLLDKGLKNFWGYNTLSFFAPHAEYAPKGTDSVREFKTMVRALHAAGIEVILDVVYNHTAEGNHMGPTLSFRGIDNFEYYRLTPDRRYYMDFTGCGNTFYMRNPRVLQLIMDSLRYWVREMHVDGFRFDLASTLARELYEVNQLSAFFEIIQQDPVLQRVKLIAEPWDLGEGGYQVGNFPVGWAEWNGKYRDAVRRFWKGDGGTVSEMATRLSGSSDLYEQSGRRPYASVNFITCHDGFTLQDLVSYNEKHNEPNKEENRDGANDNHSWNCGAEGPTDDPEILELRERQKRNLMMTLLTSQGICMIRGGDELGKSQNGNNNAYCQDNEISWLSWELTAEQKQFKDFVGSLIRWRLKQPTLQRRKYFQGRKIRGVKDIYWIDATGAEMTDQIWSRDDIRSLAVCVAGDAVDLVDDRGDKILGDTLLLLINSYHEGVAFQRPVCFAGATWERIVDTAQRAESFVWNGKEPYIVGGRSMALFRLQAKAKLQPEKSDSYIKSEAVAAR